jgi:hypothetical protein
MVLSLLAGRALEKYYPELLDQLPAELQERAVSGDQTVWADLIKEQPELFRQPPFSVMEDLAFQHLLTPKPSEQEPELLPDDSSSPLPA